MTTCFVKWTYVKVWDKKNIELSGMYDRKNEAEESRAHFRKVFPKYKASKVQRVSVEVEI